MIAFEKVHACGNDFLVVEDLPESMARFCDRWHGVGADGVMHLKGVGSRGVSLDHFDPDGSQTFCVNGVRATLACLHQQGRIPAEGVVRHQGQVLPYVMSQYACLWIPRPSVESMAFSMDGMEIRGFFVDIGNPHFIMVSDQLAESFEALAPRLRSCTAEFPEGANISWAFFDQDRWRIRTFERGVEAITLACGSAMLSAAVCLLSQGQASPICFHPDGRGMVWIREDQGGMWIEGPTGWVASGVWR